jgi:hypothetical protein
LGGRSGHNTVVDEDSFLFFLQKEKKKLKFIDSFEMIKETDKKSQQDAFGKGILPIDDSLVILREDVSDLIMKPCAKLLYGGGGRVRL